MIRVGDLSKLDTVRATTFIIDTGRASSRDDVTNAIAQALAPWSSGRRAADWLRVEPLYRKRKTDRLFRGGQGWSGSAVHCHVAIPLTLTVSAYSILLPTY